TTVLRSRGFVTSPRTARAPIRSASRASTSRRRPNMVTFARSAARASAVARPRPDDAPQTIAVRPFSPRSTLSAPPSDAGALGAEDADHFANGVGRLVEHCLFLLAQVELDDLLDTSGAELHRSAHVEPVDAVLALELCGARQDALLVLAHRVERIGDGGDDRLGRVCDGLLRHRPDALLVRRREFVAAHPRLAWYSGGDHDHVRSCGLVVAVRAGDLRFVAQRRPG